ncbi:Rha family transcriptional regulator [Paenibacillus sinopodophylli]|uniref:Rha family transcriptional regulator n=1 Tax=Paenibacillus sinopodophylli TaxID=1837342 RepID=UPI001FE3626F|nr:Rha family transcriptional regulator [Paenibacillus sinopodophylli]
MSKLVRIENGQPVTDSLIVSEVFGKEHFNVMNDIKTQLSKLEEAGESEWGSLNFQDTQYQHSQNKQWYPKYDLTEDAFAIIAMSYVTPAAMKMKVRFLEEFKRMRQQLSDPYANLSPEVRAIFAVDTKVQQLESRIDEIDGKVETQITLTQGEQRRIQKAVGARVYDFTQDSDERRSMFSELYREIKDRWGVPSYRDVLRKDMLDVIKYIEAWFPKKVSI